MTAIAGTTILGLYETNSTSTTIVTSVTKHRACESVTLDTFQISEWYLHPPLQCTLPYQYGTYSRATVLYYFTRRSTNYRYPSTVRVHYHTGIQYFSRALLYSIRIDNSTILLQYRRDQVFQKKAKGRRSGPPRGKVWSATRSGSAKAAWHACCGGAFISAYRMRYSITDRRSSVWVLNCLVC